MSKYRAVVLVPKVFEFEAEDMAKAESRAKRIAQSRAYQMSEHPKKGGGLYEGVLCEVCKVHDKVVKLTDLIAPGDVA